MMKIVTFWGGLGNQMFEYAYYEWLKKKYPNEIIYGYYPSAGLKDHNGLEVHKHFDIDLPQTCIISNIIGRVLFNANRLLRRLGLSEIATCTQKNQKFDTVFHCDYWQDKKFITDSFVMKFNLQKLSSRNKELLDEILCKDVCSVHVRRGDYLSAMNSSTYGGICTESYYKKAIQEIRTNAPNIRLAFFSDDSQYVKETFSYDNMQIVDWNKGEDSILDMYLMSQCKYMILANSTFSYWAARLNEKSNVIYCPIKWTNDNEPDIILSSWIKIK